MHADSIQLPRECIEQTADSVASTQKSIATVMIWLLGLFAVGGVAFMFDAPGGELAETLGGFGFWVALFTWLSVRYVRKARRIRDTGRLATSDPSMQWYLSGRLIVPADAQGVPQPARAFKISSRLRTVLTAVPRAQLVTRD